MDDYLSKRTLTAILFNWLFIDTEYLAKVKSIFGDYWEPDVFANNNNDVIVDIGAYNGDSISSYVNTYGMNYKKIYGYEITPEMCKEIRNVVNRLCLHDVVIKQKAAGSYNGKLYLESNSESNSANKLSKNGDFSVDVVKLDDDLKDIPTMIKMDIEGSEKDAILGLKETIKNHSPKLAICVYHGYDDLWQIPKMIKGINPNYKFYLRHNG